MIRVGHFENFFGGNIEFLFPLGKFKCIINFTLKIQHAIDGVLKFLNMISLSEIYLLLKNHLNYIQIELIYNESLLLSRGYQVD